MNTFFVVCTCTCGTHVPPVIIAADREAIAQVGLVLPPTEGCRSLQGLDTER
jgi:hypothetical protein